ncbi:MAG TPA: M3 family oligoendopeptidase [Caulobacteraceae bacterium]|jgi:oligoendopeptidase F|nr:M3 family oligoendopeptidase [Caulobacteraceae bacterium]
MSGSTAAELPVWDLSDLYAAPDDPKLAADLAAAAAEVAALKRYEGAFEAARADAARLGGLIGEAVALYQTIADRLGAVGAYAALKAQTALADPEIGKFQADLSLKIQTIALDTLFVTLELNRLEDAEIEAALNAVPDARRWTPWLRRVRLNRPHELDADLERFIAERTAAVAQWSRLYDETFARMQVKAGRETLTFNAALARLSDADAGKRERAAKGAAQAMGQVAQQTALCLNTLALEKEVEDRWRKFADPAASRHLANEIHAESVAAMTDAVVEAYPRLSHRYYALKAKVMGKSALDYWDRNAPIEKTAPAAYDWARAKQVVLASFSDLGPEFAARAQRFFDHPWIDAEPKPGKNPGAFCHPVTADRHPYVLVNFRGERRDVLTLAHELGHAVHQTLAQPLGTLLADTPLTLAETASIFAEGLTFERLLADAKPREQRGLLAGRIEDGLNTVVRQIAFHRFELAFHAARAEGEVPAEQISQIWMQTAAESLGPAITLNSGYEVWWGAVSHFVHSPFYVYAYAFGDLLVSALMERRKEDPAGFTARYEALLAGGGTRTYVEALAPFGLDPLQPAFWRMGLNRLEGLIDRFEGLV